MARRIYSIFDILEYCNSSESAIAFFQGRRLVRSNENCSHCGQLLVLSAFSANINVGYVLRCPNKQCRSRKSLLSLTFFAELHFPLRKYIALFYYWASITSISTASEHLLISENSLVDHFNLIREVCSQHLINNPIRLGGPDIVVQIDESVFVKAKYNLGHALQHQQRWVFGMYEQNTKRGFVTFVNNRNAAT